MNKLTAFSLATSFSILSTYDVVATISVKALNLAYITCMNEIYLRLISNFMGVNCTSKTATFQSSITPLYTGIIDDVLKVLLGR